MAGFAPTCLSTPRTTLTYKSEFINANVAKLVFSS